MFGHLLTQLAVAAAAVPPMDATCDAASAVQPLHEIIAADNRGEIQQVLKFYTSDPVWISASAPPLRGVKAIEESYGRMYRDFTPHLEIVVDRVRSNAGVAVVNGRTDGWLEPRGTATARLVADDFEAVVLCVSGKWAVSTLRWWPQPGIKK